MKTEIFKVKAILCGNAFIFRRPSDTSATYLPV
jgi:hypothetical protein